MGTRRLLAADVYVFLNNKKVLNLLRMALRVLLWPFLSMQMASTYQPPCTAVHVGWSLVHEAIWLTARCTLVVRVKRDGGMIFGNASGEKTVM